MPLSREVHCIIFLKLTPMRVRGNDRLIFLDTILPVAVLSYAKYMPYNFLFNGSESVNFQSNLSSLYFVYLPGITHPERMFFQSVCLYLESMFTIVSTSST